ncbi:hypothetical protein ICM_06334 [Bacillus cereus BAG1X2-3]|uniref:Uncharacterized protein n=1 Tax=Bacillus cereus TaxID=1396 RepID=A0A9X7E6X8_BACCE|nr:hypothetical protein ICC_06595 [Bacillus cereus BAG1X1-1]EOO42376.1 hypothetical protein ICI_06537 [Bacillus cereus BAG1X2-1]EOO44004.1 hypothetical protein ICK_06563 [Bacillus cereus BAG1X2-2]EOO56032.1 hypothetical protein ICM_06334 [Bacillus cereus BAG1X2-3]EOO99972.1 hypothetical protein ICO_06744 [Bacillus cereus BAG2O-1]PHA25985.1 hypothetical protein COE70_02895 [Bacillus cereus]
MKIIFIYNKITSAIVNRADTMGLAVFQVNLAYTAISGKMEYMRELDISIYQSAALQLVVVV